MFRRLPFGLAISVLISMLTLTASLANAQPNPVSNLNMRHDVALAAKTRWIDACTAAPYGGACVGLRGIAGTTYVDYASAFRIKASWSLICHYSGRVYIVGPKGNILWTQAASRNTCSVGRAGFNFTVNRYFPSGSKVCARFRESNVIQGGQPCLTLKGRTS